MHNITIKSKIRNPDIETSITVPQFDTLEEAVIVSGKEYCLQIINEDAIRIARTDWNNRIINELYNKRRTSKSE